jgi:hypothetical protein
MERKGTAVGHLHKDQTGIRETKVWFSRNMERTSIDEVHDIVDDANRDLLNPRNVVVLQTDTSGEEMHPFQFKLSVEDMPIGVADGTQRVNSIVTFSAENEKYGSISANSIQREVTEARVRSHHTLLYKLYQLPNERLNAPYRKRCIQAFHNAFERGLGFAVDKIYYDSEDQLTEFKCCQRELWSEKAFVAAFREFVPKSLAAFINVIVVSGQIPLEDPYILFGVHSDSTIHGIRFRKSPGETLNFKDKRDQLKEWLHAELNKRIVRVSQNYKDKLISFAVVDIIQIQNSAQDLGETRALVKVSLKIDSGFILRPCWLLDHGKEEKIYYRSPKPELKSVEVGKDDQSGIWTNLFQGQ